MNIKVEFSDDNGNWCEVLTLTEISKLSYVASTKIVKFSVGTGLYDCTNTELFVGDKLRYYTCKRKQPDGSFKPIWITDKLSFISDLYGSPFRAGERCEIIRDLE